MSGYNHLSPRKDKFSRTLTESRSNLNKHGHFNFPPFGIIEKILMKNRSNRVFATTTSWVMVKKPTRDILKYRYSNEIDHPNHAQKTENN